MNLLTWQVTVVACFASMVFCGAINNAAENIGDEDKPKGRINDNNSGPCPAQNSKFPVYLPHPDSCNKFYICDGGKPHLKTCFPGLHFNPKIRACDYPENAGCETDNEKPKGKIIDDNLGPCPAQNSKFPVYLPHPDSCNKFYICDSGKPHLKTCFPGLHFNPKIKACDHPENAGCKTGVEEEPKGKITDDNSGPCPAQNSKFPVYLPHPDSCNKFYICDSGKPHLKTCFPGLHFNSKIKACDYPENAGCERGDEEKPKERITNDDLGPCPAQNSKSPVYLPHPDYCNKFYICDSGKPHLKTCSPGLHFNPKIKACDYPENAGCETDFSSKRDKRMMNDDIQDSCQVKGNGRPVFMTHPTECEKYFICRGGKKFPFTCQSGLHFNPQQEGCDYPENANCGENALELPGEAFLDNHFSISCPDGDSPDNPIVHPHPTDCDKFYLCDHGKPVLKRCPPDLNFSDKIQACDYAENTVCKNQVTFEFAGVRSPFCPSRDGKMPVFFRHPTNCSVYYMCGNGMAYEFVCPARLHFNLRKKVCDYEENAKCRTVNP